MLASHIQRASRGAPLASVVMPREPALLDSHSHLEQTMTGTMIRGLSLALVLALGACASAPRLAQDIDRAQQERAVRQFWDSFNRASWAELGEFVTPDYRHHPPGKTLNLAQFKAGGQWVHSGLANYRLTIDSLVQDGNQVATRWTARGIHSGSLFGEPISGREMTVQGMTFFVFTGARISEDHEVIDLEGFARQLKAK